MSAKGEVKEEPIIPEPTVPLEIISYWQPNLTISIVDDFARYARSSMPPQLLGAMQFNSDGNYFPVIFFNNFWLLKEHYLQINNSLSHLPLHLTYEPLSLMKWQLMVQMDQSFTMQKQFGAVESEIDDIKRMLYETNPYLLGLTFVVSILHMVFDFLAFKNDISFWRNNKSMEGLSVRTIFLNTFCQLIIFLYLFDNETSWMILLSCGIGLVIEFWKIQKSS